MSDGGRVESRGEREQDQARINRAGSRDLGSAISRVAVAQICESVGFEGSTESAIDSFSEIAVRYISDLGKIATFYANLSGRSECSIFDIVSGLEDLGSQSGFMEVNSCRFDSGVMKEIVDYVDNSEDIPFAQPISRFPVINVPKMIPSFERMGEKPEANHIPPWLPAFPDPHTYIHTATWNERESNPRDDKIELVRQRRKAEMSLLNLQQRLLCYGLPAASSSQKPRSTGENDESENPFLAKTLQAGEKDVSSIALPANFSTIGRGSLLETFSPAIEAMKDGISESEIGSDRRNGTDKRRPAVCLEFKPGKKVLGDSLDLRLWNKGSARAGASWFRRDDDNNIKDDKKRRAELILRQAMENQQELTQL
ncbi:unnamed protein product [Cuscuta campestris]|uniref:Transcription initiation factor TFIID subunit 8 n=1 Tax=Cuscuta campestris TaxID=132261 RepID=A0A484N950_9ASTE|nr:unnamed protein product [Cuscuta campestris]